MLKGRQALLLLHQKQKMEDQGYETPPHTLSTSCFSGSVLFPKALKQEEGPPPTPATTFSPGQLHANDNKKDVVRSISPPNCTTDRRIAVSSTSLSSHFSQFQTLRGESAVDSSKGLNHHDNDGEKVAPHVNREEYAATLPPHSATILQIAWHSDDHCPSYMVTDRDDLLNDDKRTHEESNNEKEKGTQNQENQLHPVRPLLSSRRKCQAAGCNKTRHFGFKQERKMVFCSSHKEPGMINLSRKICEHESCARPASFGHHTERRKVFCSEHKEQNMTNLSQRLCLHHGCKKTANYGHHGGKTMYCSKHKEASMALKTSWSLRRCARRRCARPAARPGGLCPAHGGEEEPPSPAAAAAGEVVPLPLLSLACIDAIRGVKEEPGMAQTPGYYSDFEALAALLAS